MQLTFLGAAHEVTGSCYLLETKGKRILIDCGMWQGSDFNEGKNFDPFLFDPATLDAVLITHAHLDHTGRIPKLVKEGFKGKIYATKATCELAKIVWQDAYGIMEYDHRKFQSPILYSPDDIETASARCSGVNYSEPQDLGDGISAVWKDAGHIFGAAFIEVTAQNKTVVFSGDIGNVGMPILRETDPLGRPDVLLCESTYGDRAQEPPAERDRILLQLLTEAAKRGGTIMVPSFSIERTQEFIYRLHGFFEAHRLPDMPIFLDSPMAIAAIEVFKKYPEYYDREAAKLHMMGDDFLSLPRLHLTTSKEESKAINNVRGPKMIIAGAGMMNGGRILHHAHRYLPDRNSTLLIIGYQSQGTLGRRLYEGAETVTIFGDVIQVFCTVKAIGGLSAHGDQDKLVSWIRGAEKIPERVYCVHGEPHAATALAHRLRDDLHIKTFVPERGETVEI